jgi:RNA polymerase sigma-70 factor (ECF subfamily)
MLRLARRDQSALEMLYDRYSRTVYSLVLRITRQAAVAEEIVQDVFLSLWRNAHRFEAARGRLGAWLLTLARNRALDHLRGKLAKQQQREDELAPDAFVPAAPDLAETVDLNRRAEKVRGLMGDLPETQRQAIELAFFDGMTHSEIADRLQQPLGTIKSWIRTGLLRLREGLEQPT